MSEWGSTKVWSDARKDLGERIEAAESVVNLARAQGRDPQEFLAEICDRLGIPRRR